MTTENKQKVFLFSPQAAESYGYSLGLKEDGTTVAYTVIYDSENNNYGWKDKVVAYKGSSDDFIAVKQFNKEEGKIHIINNKTSEIDPFLKLAKYPSLKDYVKGGTDFTIPPDFKAQLIERIQGVNKTIFFTDGEVPQKKLKK